MDTGMTMLIKAMGIDPKQLVAKGEELEKLGKALAADLQQKVALMDGRLSRIESMLTYLVRTSEQVESHVAGVVPAGHTESQEREKVYGG